MDQSEVKELYFITPIENVPSILEHGILCHNLSEMILHRSISMPEIQERREQKEIPGGGNLHDFANLYFDAWNPMLYKRKNMNDQICILVVDPSVLDLENVIITDRNASSDYVIFYPSPQGLSELNSAKIFSKDWRSENPYEYLENKSIKCAEVLVPKKVETEYITKAYVANETALKALKNHGIQLDVKIKSAIFFQ